MVDILLRLSALTFRRFSYEYDAFPAEGTHCESVDPGTLLNRYERISGYSGGLVDLDLCSLSPEHDFCGLTVTVVRPLAWGATDSLALHHFLPRFSIPGFRLSPIIRLAFGPVTGWFANG